MVCSALPAQSPSTYPREPSRAVSACWGRQSTSHIPRGYTWESSRQSISQALPMENSEILSLPHQSPSFPTPNLSPKQRLSTVLNTNTSDLASFEAKQAILRKSHIFCLCYQTKSSPNSGNILSRGSRHDFRRLSDLVYTGPDTELLSVVCPIILHPVR